MTTTRPQQTLASLTAGSTCVLADHGDYNIALGLVRWCYVHNERHIDTASHVNVGACVCGHSVGTHRTRSIDVQRAWCQHVGC